MDGPAGVLGFKPKWQPEDHRSFFTAPEGWGLFVQRQSEEKQTQRIEVRHGRLRLKTLVFSAPMAAAAAVTVDGKPVPSSHQQADDEVRITLAQETIVPEGSTIQVTLQAVG